MFDRNDAARGQPEAKREREMRKTITQTVRGSCWLRRMQLILIKHFVVIKIHGGSANFYVFICCLWSSPRFISHIDLYRLSTLCVSYVCRPSAFHRPISRNFVCAETRRSKLGRRIQQQCRRRRHYKCALCVCHIFGMVRNERMAAHA